MTQVPFQVEGKELMLAIPREALGMKTGDVIEFYFKWWDNPQRPGNIMDVYLDGDVAPDARFKYRYSSQKQADLKD